MSEKARHPGIAVRHRKRCASHHQRACSCRPSYQAQVWSPRDDTPIRRSFPTLAAARAWRAEAQVAVRRGQLGLGSQLTVRDAAQAFIAGAWAGTIRNRSGDPYKPSVIRGYETYCACASSRRSAARSSPRSAASTCSASSTVSSPRALTPAACATR